MGKPVKIMFTLRCPGCDASEERRARYCRKQVMCKTCGAGMKIEGITGLVAEGGGNVAYLREGDDFIRVRVQ